MPKLPPLDITDEWESAINSAVAAAGGSRANWLREHAIRPALGVAGSHLPAVTNGGNDRVLAGRKNHQKKKR